MFDIGFWELSLIAVIALLVVGPERLPRLARTAGLWFGKAKGFIATVKADVDRELRTEELKRTMEEQKEKSGMYDIFDETKSAVEELEREQQHLSGDVTDEDASRPRKPDEPAAPRGEEAEGGGSEAGPAQETQESNRRSDDG